MQTTTTNELIDLLVNTLCGPSTSARKVYLLRQSLLALVRLAKIEHQTQINKDVAKATRLARLSDSRRLARRLLEDFSSKNQLNQDRLRFD